MTTTCLSLFLFALKQDPLLTGFQREHLYVEHGIDLTMNAHVMPRF